MIDAGRLYHKRKHVAAEAAEEYQVVLRETPPQPCLDPPIVRMAR